MADLSSAVNEALSLSQVVLYKSGSPEYPPTPP